MQKYQTVWSSNVTHPTAGFVAAQLQDSGNIFIQGFPNNTSRGNGTIIWQSFQYPADSVLPNMKFILNNNPEFRKVVQAWKSPSDPSVGRYSVGTNSRFFQIIIWDGDRPYWRSGPWNGNIFMGTRYYNTGYGKYLINTGSFAQEEVRGMLSLVFTGANETLLPRYVIIDQGILAESGGMIARRTGELRGMPRKIYVTPMNAEEWRRGNWTSGCVRRKKLQCGVQGGKQDGFLRLKMMKVPVNADIAEWFVGLNPDQCRTTCLANCSCLAYTHDTGTGCMRWSENLIDIEDLSPGGVDLFIRLEQSELSTSKRYDFRNSSDCHYHILPVQMESSEKG
uniref:Apple domain-containing protein n=1 Tax=Chenopodium quinoa TaxID=63459 RepID=A0A803ND25_CHEQI